MRPGPNGFAAHREASLPGWGPFFQGPNRGSFRGHKGEVVKQGLTFKTLQSQGDSGHICDFGNWLDGNHEI